MSGAQDLFIESKLGKKPMKISKGKAHKLFDNGELMSIRMCVHLEVKNVHSVILEREKTCSLVI